MIPRSVGKLRQCARRKSEVSSRVNDTILGHAIFWLYLCSYMIVNGCYASVGLFCTVCNDIYSKMLIVGSIMTENEQKLTFFKKFSDMINDYKHYRMVPKHLRKTFANFYCSI